MSIATTTVSAYDDLSEKYLLFVNVITAVDAKDGENLAWNGLCII